MAGGWRFVTRPEFDALLRKFHEVTERSRLSLAALETLAIIAYRQPITLPEIQEIRGVNSLERSEDALREEAHHDGGEEVRRRHAVLLPNDARIPRCASA